MKNDIKHKLGEVTYSGYKDRKESRRKRRINKKVRVDEDMNAVENPSHYEDWDGPCRSFDYKYIDRLLRSKIGQNFDNVVSELMSKVDSRTYHGRKLQEQLDYIRKVDDEVIKQVTGDRYVRIKVDDIYFGYGCFYIDSKGNLQYLEDRKRPKYMPSHPYKFVGEKVYQVIDDVWYELILETLPAKKSGKTFVYTDNPNISKSEFIAIFLKYANIKYYYTRTNLYRWCMNTLDKLAWEYGLDKKGHVRKMVSKRAMNKAEIKKVKAALGVAA